MAINLSIKQEPRGQLGDVSANISESKRLRIIDALTGSPVMVKAFRDLEQGCINLRENAKLRGDEYDVGYCDAMARHCQAAIAILEN